MRLVNVLIFFVIIALFVDNCFGQTMQSDSIFGYCSSYMCNHTIPYVMYTIYERNVKLWKAFRGGIRKSVNVPEVIKHQFKKKNHFKRV